MGLVVRSGRLQGGKFVILLLISAEEAADGEQDEGCDGEIVDRQSDGSGALCVRIPDNR